MIPRLTKLSTRLQARRTPSITQPRLRKLATTVQEDDGFTGANAFYVEQSGWYCIVESIPNKTLVYRHWKEGLYIDVLSKNQLTAPYRPQLSWRELGCLLQQLRWKATSLTFWRCRWWNQRTTKPSFRQYTTGCSKDVGPWILNEISNSGPVPQTISLIISKYSF